MAFLEVFEYFWDQYGQATEKNNQEHGVTLWSVVTAQRDRETNWPFWPSAHVCLLCETRNATLCTYYLMVTKKTGKYVRAYKNWLVRPENQETLAYLKYFWRIRHLKIWRSNPMKTQYKYSRSTSGNKGENNYVVTVLQNCANQIINGQQELQNRQEHFQQIIAAQMMAMQQ